MEAPDLECGMCKDGTCKNLHHLVIGWQLQQHSVKCIWLPKLLKVLHGHFLWSTKHKATHGLFCFECDFELWRGFFGDLEAMLWWRVCGVNCAPEDPGWNGLSELLSARFQDGYRMEMALVLLFDDFWWEQDVGSTFLLYWPLHTFY